MSQKTRTSRPLSEQEKAIAAMAAFLANKGRQQHMPVVSEPIYEQPQEQLQSRPEDFADISAYLRGDKQLIDDGVRSSQEVVSQPMINVEGVFHKPSNSTVHKTKKKPTESKTNYRKIDLGEPEYIDEGVAALDNIERIRQAMDSVGGSEYQDLIGAELLDNEQRLEGVNSNVASTLAASESRRADKSALSSLLGLRAAELKAKEGGNAIAEKLLLQGLKNEGALNVANLKAKTSKEIGKEKNAVNVEIAKQLKGSKEYESNRRSTDQRIKAVDDRLSAKIKAINDLNIDPAIAEQQIRQAVLDADREKSMITKSHGDLGAPVDSKIVLNRRKALEYLRKQQPTPDVLGKISVLERVLGVESRSR